MQKLLNHLATVLTAVLVVLFCTSGLWDSFKNDCLLTKPNEPGDGSEEGILAPPPAADETTDTEEETAPPAEMFQPPDLSAPETEAAEPEFTVAPEGYFADALFVGDSRTLGLWEYGDLEDATFFATTGMSVYSVYYEEVSNRSLETVLTSHTFKKIYVMLGINELGYDMNKTVREYRALIRWIRQLQPEAIVYIEANLHVSASRSGTDSIYNNENIDLFNSRIAQLADGKQVFYLDVNSQFDDGEGNLADKYTADDTHVLAKYYRQWSGWIMENAIVI